MTSGATAATRITAEVRSVNGRFLDLSLRLPDELRALEPRLRERVGAQVRRGKVELRLTVQQTRTDQFPSPSAEALNRLSRLEAQVQTWLPHARGLSVDEVLSWCRGSSAESETLDADALAVASACLEGLREAREREGARLVALLLERTAELRALAARAAPLVPQLVERQQQRFLDRWAEALGSASGSASGSGSLSVDAVRDRALAEAAAYALRIDVAEELGRLVAHLDEIERLLAAGGELGKRLDFLVQELHREANTLGSKAAVLELSTIALDMKVAIEQMREQVQNIE